ncbi:kelch-like protein 12 [Dendronephthya gigantea]|uniref:kelch-like protein 12 n=1 Tax=Dendronephthya gigantea TaxID=151771 RepID=UPI001069CD02|nr:kelch-like protein 12 [Dendronephthya gigantea]
MASTLRRSTMDVMIKNYVDKAQGKSPSTCEENLSNLEYSHSIMKTLNKYRQAETFCDVCLLVEEGEMLAHRNVLAASSPYFERLLNSTMKEREQYKIRLNGMNVKVLKDVLDYIYIGDIVLSAEKSFDLIIAADYLMLGRLKNLAENHFLNEHLNFDNCLSTWIFADRYQCQRLQAKAKELVLASFFSITNSKGFLSLDVSYIIELLGSEGLAASDCEAIDAALKWIDHNSLLRAKHLDQLINYIDLTCLPDGYISTVISSREYAKSSNILKRAVQSINVMAINSDDLASQGEPVGYHGNKAILVVGGWERGKGGTAGVFCFFPSLNKWCLLKNMNIARYRHGIAVHGHVVYAVGGSLAADDSCIECLNLNQPGLPWKRLLPMCSGHIGVAVAFLKDYLYISGGFCGKTLNTVQRYSPAINNWETLSPMMQAREGHCLIACGNFVYAIGGCCGQDNSEVLKGVERYDPLCDSWFPVMPMKTQRYGACGVELNQKIYVFGGQLNVYTEGPTIQTNFRTCEVYCPKINQWNTIAELNIARLRSCAAAVGHRIYVFGGYLHGSYLDSVECYDSRKGTWTITSTVCMPSRLEGAACCAVQLKGEIFATLLPMIADKGN